MSPWSRLRADFVPAKLVRAVAVGWLMGAVIVIHCIALSAVVFSGPMLPFAVQGAGMMLFGGLVFCLLIGVTSSFPGMLAVPQEVPATVIGTLGAAVVGSTAGGPDASSFMTMAAMLVLSGLLTGVAFLAIGKFRLSYLFRFIPYPVAGGFFAGAGWVLSVAALSVMSGMVLDWQTLPRMFEPAAMSKWGPGAAYGLALAFVMRRRANLVVMIGSLLIVSALYHAGLAFFDLSVEDARAQGFLLSGMPEVGLWPAFGPGDLGRVDWNVVAGQIPALLTVTLVTLLCLLVTVNGLEVATGVEVDLDREFRAAGLAGVCAGAGGSAPGCHSFALTLPCRMFGADTPWVGVVVAFVLGVSLFFGNGILTLLPMPIIGGLLLFIGISLLDNWLVKVRERLHWTDYGVIVLIAVTVAVFGFIEGVGAGMLATLTLFAIRLSRVDVVEEEFTGREQQSTKLRSVPDRVMLLDRGELLRAYRLRGYIFFGTAHPLIARLKQPLREHPPPACILLDFAAVSGCDFSAVNALCQFVQSADLAGVRAVFSAAPGSFEEGLRRNLPAQVWRRLRFETDLDHGLERCEDMIVTAAASGLSEPSNRQRGRLLDRVTEDLGRRLAGLAQFEELLEELEPWLEPREYEAGEALAVRGEVQDGLQLVVFGQAVVHDADGARLFQCGPGDVVESWAAFSEHVAAATVIAREPCRTMLLTSAARELLESDDNALTLRLLAFLVSRRPPGRLSPETGP
ncbi:MAG: SulP family inorganic anion transporter [Immundisolibacterales bacterium]|nr:SulP family inorganic anion transporter [Immundisolibacterales bacterium]